MIIAICFPLVWGFMWGGLVGLLLAPFNPPFWVSILLCGSVPVVTWWLWGRELQKKLEEE